MRAVHLLANPAVSSRRRLRRNDATRRAIESRGHPVELITPPSAAEVATEVARAVSAGMERLVIAGGDGLVHRALPALAGTDVVVGVVAIGSGNDFARALELPTSIDAAVETALGPAAPIDLISADDGARWAASVVTAGFSGDVNARANDLRFPPGQQRYTVATVLELARLAPLELTLTLDGVDHHCDSTFFAVANTRYFGGGMAICPAADPTDGLLDVTIVGAASRLTVARVLPLVFSGRHVDHPAVSTHRAATVRIDTPSPLWADGEPFGGTTLTTASSSLTVAGAGTIGRG